MLGFGGKSWCVMKNVVECWGLMEKVECLGFDGKCWCLMENIVECRGAGGC